jgi:hypothetical protein
MALLVTSVELVVVARPRALSARAWSPIIGEALPVLIAWGAS